MMRISAFGLMVALTAALSVGSAVAADPPPVVVLFEDDVDSLIPQLTNNNDSVFVEYPASGVEKDVFSGLRCLQVAPFQRYCPELKDWNFPIKKNPGVGEYRYLRFAWKKLGAGPVMVQLCGKDGDWEQRWNHRYQMGAEGLPWTAKRLSLTTPTEWTVVTRDLASDWEEFQLTGFAFTPIEQSAAMFDHVILGRTIEDLDRATHSALKARKQIPKATDAQLNAWWSKLQDDDPMIADAARWSMVAHREQSTPYLLNKVVVPKLDGGPPIVSAKVSAAITDLGHYRFVVREAAAKELASIGPRVIPQLLAALDKADETHRTYIHSVLRRWKSAEVGERVRLTRCVQILSADGSAEANRKRSEIEAFFKQAPAIKEK